MISNDQERAQAAEYYQPLVGLNLIGMLETDWPTLLLSHPKTGKEYEVVASQDPEGNGPGFLFFETGDPDETDLSMDGLVVSSFELVQDEYSDWISWPTLICERPGKTPLKVVVSQDPEGNGEGHLFGVPTAQEIAVEDGFGVGPRLRESELASRQILTPDDSGPSL